MSQHIVKLNNLNKTALKNKIIFLYMQTSKEQVKSDHSNEITHITVSVLLLFDLFIFALIISKVFKYFLMIFKFYVLINLTLK